MCLAPAPGGVFIEIKAKPRSAKPGLGPVEGGALVARLASPPADGAANAELVKLISKAFRVPKSSIEIARGEAAREKRVLVKGAGLQEITDIVKGLGK